MLKKYITPLLIAFAGFGLNAQCPPGDVILSSQAEVDAFVADYPDCTELAGDVLIGDFEGTTDIVNISGLSNLTSIVGSLHILRNSDITSLIGLDQLTSIEGNLYLGFNNGIASLTGLSQLSSINGRFTLIKNDNLTSLTGLGQLSSIGGGFAVVRNDTLTSLTGLEGLTTIGGSLQVIENSNLTSLTGLEGLVAIGRDLNIEDNVVLGSLTGLENLNATTINNLVITWNSQLSNCTIESICDYLGMAMNTVAISGNATGCATREEVETACMVPATDISQTNIELFPNPTNGMLQLRNITAKEVVIYTAQGQRIARYGNPGQELNLSALPAGVYHLHLITADAVFAARVMKQ
ncbi:T9SS type A sorting domain-containing protein [Phaeodactylibacter xiamenensis]|uniref:T9SS type A sorting domain-containing protein n=2 Tax=Phaeodactylibacter xiamenensis TaxID=1524460 RepID=UPI003BAC2E89